MTRHHRVKPTILLLVTPMNFSSVTSELNAVQFHVTMIVDRQQSSSVHYWVRDVPLDCSYEAIKAVICLDRRVALSDPRYSFFGCSL